MADTPINDAAEKAYAEASEKAVIAKPAAAAPIKADAPAVKVAAPAVAAAPVVAKAAPAAAPVVVPATPAKKPAPAKLAVKRAAKPVAAKPAEKAANVVKAKPGRKPGVKIAKVAKIAPKVKTPVSKPVPTLISKLKEITMVTTAKKTTEDFSSKIQGAMKDAQDRAKTAFEKGQAAMGEANEFSKGNLEALVETGKALASGMQTLGKNYVEEVKSAFSTIQADAKVLTSVKSPKEFVAMQSKLVRKYFDGVVAYNSKSAEAALKLANEAFQPISSRVSLAVEKVRKAA